jgi:hypothetical protein
MPVGTRLLDAIEEAIASTPWYLPRAPVLQLVGRREILGQYGAGQGAVFPGEKYETAEPVTHPDILFSFTRSQCKRMVKQLRREAKLALRQQ